MKLTIKNLRQLAGLSQEQVAKELELSLTGYANKEQGKSKFYFSEVVALSKLFNIDIHFFLDNECL
jgi:transcriptional regulator with XRE-family HTH domain